MGMQLECFGYRRQRMQTVISPTLYHAVGQNGTTIRSSKWFAGFPGLLVEEPHKGGNHKELEFKGVRIDFCFYGCGLPCKMSIGCSARSTIRAPETIEGHGFRAKVMKLLYHANVACTDSCACNCNFSMA